MDMDQVFDENEGCIQAQGGTDDDEANCENDESRQPHNFEEVINTMGPPGRYQILQCLLTCVNHLPCVFINMSFVFIGFEPSFTCSMVNETSWAQYLSTNMNGSSLYTVSYEDCGVRISRNTSGNTEDFDMIECNNGHSYKGGKHVSIITEWDLVCDKRGTAEMVMAVVALGWCIGGFFASIFSDKYGRKTTILVATALCATSEVSCAFSPNVFVMIALRFCSGFFGSGISSISFVLGAELFVSKHRETYSVYISLLYSFFTLLVCGIAYLFRENSWRDLHLCLAISCMSPLVFNCFVDESASWLYSQGNSERASRIIRRACRVNGFEFDKIKYTWDRLCVPDSTQYNVEKPAKKYNILDIFRDRKLRISLIIAWFVFLSNSFSFFGLYLSASTLSGNLYLNTTLMALLEFPGCFWTLAMLKYKGRRFVVMFFMTMAAICLVVSTVVGSVVTTNTHHIENTSTAFFLLGRLAIGNSYSTLYLYVSELFPTTLRSSGSGFCIAGASIGLMLAPYLMPLHAWVAWAPGTCLVLTLTFATILMLKLPETKGEQLASNIEG